MRLPGVPNLASMSESAQALLIAGVVGVAILLGPLALLAAGVIGAGGMLALQALALGGIYIAAVVLRGRREP